MPVRDPLRRRDADSLLERIRQRLGLTEDPEQQDPPGDRRKRALEAMLAGARPAPAAADATAVAARPRADHLMGPGLEAARAARVPGMPTAPDPAAFNRRSLPPAPAPVAPDAAPAPSPRAAAMQRLLEGVPAPALAAGTTTEHAVEKEIAANRAALQETYEEGPFGAAPGLAGAAGRAAWQPVRKAARFGRGVSMAIPGDPLAAIEDRVMPGPGAAAYLDTVEPSTADLLAQVAGTLTGVGTAIGATNRMVASAAPLAARGSRTRALLESFDPRVRLPVGRAAVQGAVEGLPLDIGYALESDSPMPVVAGVGLGATLNPIFRRSGVAALDEIARPAPPRPLAARGAAEAGTRAPEPRPGRLRAILEGRRVPEPAKAAAAATGAGALAGAALAPEGEKAEGAAGAAAAASILGVPGKGRFYSRLERAIETGPAKTTAKKWLDRIRSGAHREERSFTGIEDFLGADPARSLTKEEVLEAARRKPVNVGEERGRGDFKNYTETGGEGYREVVLTLDQPRKRALGDDERDRLARLNGKEMNAAEGNGPPLTHEEMEEWADLRARYNAEGQGGAVYRSPHWPGVDNPVAHVRLKDRTGPNGEKVRHIEEIQSDWAQQGRKKGFQTEEQTRTRELLAERDRIVERGSMRMTDRGTTWAPRSEDAARLREIDELLDRTPTGGYPGHSVPDMPFKETSDWLGLAMKRVIDEAVEDGVDRIAWTPGARQAERYDLSKQISRVEWREGDDYFRAFDLDGKQAVSRRVPREQLEDVVGKEVAQRLVGAPVQRGYRTIEGVDLKVGGEGMRSFYDEILPAWVQKYARQMGVELEVQGARLADAGEADFPSFRIPDELRERIRTEGQPLLAAGAPVAGAAIGAQTGETDEERERLMRIGTALGAGAAAIGLARVVRSRRGGRVVRLRGDEFGGGPTGVLRDAARRFAFENLAGRTVVNRQQRREIRIPKRGLKKTLAHGARREHVQSIAALPQLLEHGRLVRTEANRDPGRAKEVPFFHTYEARLRIGKTPWRARLIVRETNEGHLFYDHDLSSIEPASRRSAPTGPNPGVTEPANETGSRPNVADGPSGLKGEEGGAPVAALAPLATAGAGAAAGAAAGDDEDRTRNVILGIGAGAAAGAAGVALARRMRGGADLEPVGRSLPATTPKRTPADPDYRRIAPAGSGSVYRDAQKRAMEATDDELREGYLAAVRHATLEQAGASAAPSTESFQKAVQATGTKKGAHVAASSARGRLGQAEHRRVAYEQELEARGLPAPDPDEAWIDVAADELPVVLRDEHAELGALSGHALADRLEAAERAAAEAADDVEAQLRRALLAGEVLRRDRAEATAVQRYESRQDERFEVAARRGEAASRPLPADFDPDDYLNPARFETEARERLREEVTRVSQELGVDYKEREPWSKVRAEASRIERRWGLEVGALNRVQPDSMNRAEILAAARVVDRNVKALEHFSEIAADGIRQMETGISAEDAYDAIARLEEFNTQVLGKLMRAGTEKGRDLNAMKILANSTLEPSTWLARAKRMLGDHPLTLEHTTKIRELINGIQAGTKTRDDLARYIWSLKRASATERFLTLRKAGLLTGIKSSGKNIISNTTFGHLENAKDAPALVADRFFGMAVWALSRGRVAPTITKGTPPGRLAAILAGGAAGAALPADDGEQRAAQAAAGATLLGGFSRAAAKGAKAGAREAVEMFGLPKAAAAFRRGRVDEALAEMASAIRSGEIPPDANVKWDAYRGVNFDSAFVDVYTKAVFKNLVAQDRVFKKAALFRALEELAQAQALREGLKRRTPDFTDRVAELIARPPDEMAALAIEAAEVATFTNKGALGAVAQGAKRAAMERSQALGATLDWIMPFTMTPANVATRALEYSVGGVPTLMLDVPKLFWKAAKGQKDLALQRKIVDRLGRQSMGLAAMYAGYHLAEAGLLTGIFPETERERELWKATGRKANAILVDGEWRSLEGISPMGNLMAVGANIHEYLQDPENTAWGALGLGTATIAKTVTEQSFMQGVQDVLEAVDDPKRYAINYVKRQPASMVPTIVRHAAQAVDPVMRESDEGVSAKSIKQEVQKGVPFLSRDLPASKTEFGDERRRPGGLQAILDPFYSSPDRRGEDPLLAEMERIGTGPTRLDREKAAGETLEEWRERRDTLGPALRRHLEAVVGLRPARGPRELMDELGRDGAGLDERIRAREYQRAGDAEKREILEDAMTAFRRAGNRPFRAILEGR